MTDGPADFRHSVRVCYHSDAVPPTPPAGRKIPGFSARDHRTMTMDYAKARELMVEQQVRPWDVLDARVLDALVDGAARCLRAAAHRDAGLCRPAALPLGHGEFDDEAGGRRPRAAGAGRAGRRRRARDRHRQRLPHRLPGPPGARSAQHRDPRRPRRRRARAPGRDGPGRQRPDRSRRRVRLATPTAASTRSA